MEAAADTKQPLTEYLGPELPDASSTTSLVLDSQSMNQMMEVAKIMATARATIPKHLQGNQADCMAVIMQSMQWRMNPFAVAQKTHIVNGVLGYESQLVNAVITSRAPVKGRLQFEWSGDWSKIIGKFREVESKTKMDDDGHPKKYRMPAWNIADEAGLKVKVWATFKGEEKPRELELFMTQARTRNSTLWTDDPKQQLAYLATKRWARLYCPDVILGVYTPDELDEERPPMKDITPNRQSASDVAEGARLKIDESLRPELTAALQEAMEKDGIKGMQKVWNGWTKDQRATVGIAERDRIAAWKPKPKEETKTSSGPTYAELMERIKKAAAHEELDSIISDSMHLPEDQRAEIAAACEAKFHG